MEDYACATQRIAQACLSPQLEEDRRTVSGFLLHFHSPEQPHRHEQSQTSFTFCQQIPHYFPSKKDKSNAVAAQSEFPFTSGLKVGLLFIPSSYMLSSVSRYICSYTCI